MTKEETARNNWKAALAMFGKGSAEELAAYNLYIKTKSGEGLKRKERKPRTVNKAAPLVSASLF
jgi:hypothetical protein